MNKRIIILIIVSILIFIGIIGLYFYIKVKNTFTCSGKLASFSGHYDNDLEQLSSIEDIKCADNEILKSSTIKKGGKFIRKNVLGQPLENLSQTKYGILDESCDVGSHLNGYKIDKNVIKLTCESKKKLI